MNLSGRLEQLEGHRVAVDIHGGEDGYRLTGTLREVGEDYIMITGWDSIARFSIPGQYFIKVDTGISIIHTADCKQCGGKN